ncbi:MAG: hypothetical protein P0Y65_13725 [Candidatus Devosia phytovorans]|uniref:Uncharacterized protein n=1 Tax=Candidatus Devosia phytovorans TaxID=3121372 RepID=A0AAJ5VR70_9HYPH|nr:hypothetical protein [Devosia sp.]WEK03251.1 MAG: hypothetical protein P0Y65_13725 [Devosia sp.]
MSEGLGQAIEIFEREILELDEVVRVVTEYGEVVSAVVSDWLLLRKRVRTRLH